MRVASYAARQAKVRAAPGWGWIWAVLLATSLLVMIGFALLDTLLPDAADYYDPPRSSLRWSVATLIPTVPLFLWLNRRVVAATRGDAGRRRSLVRKWLASVTLLVAALTLLGDGVAVIYAALNGDLTARFAAKAALIAVVGAIALAYYRDEIDG